MIPLTFCLRAQLPDYSGYGSHFFRARVFQTFLDFLLLYFSLKQNVSTEIRAVVPLEAEEWDKRKDTRWTFLVGYPCSEE